MSFFRSKIWFFIGFAVVVSVGCSGPKSAKNDDLAVRSSYDDNAVSYYIDGLVQELNGDYHSAVVDFEKAYAFDSSATIANSLVQSYLKVGRMNDALAVVQSILKQTPDDIQALLSLADIKLRGHNYREAVDILENVYLRRSGDINLIHRIISIYEILKDHESPVRFYQRLIDIGSPNLAVFVKLGGHYVQRKEFQKAYEVYKAGHQRNSSNLFLLEGLAKTSEKLGNTAEAIGYYEQILRYRHNRGLLVHLASLCLTARDYEKAHVYLKRVDDLFTPHHEIKRSIGFVLDQLGKPEEAKEYLHGALELSPYDIGSIGLLARIYEGQGQYAVSDSLYEQILTLSPSDALTLNNYSYNLAQRGPEPRAGPCDGYQSARI